MAAADGTPSVASDALRSGRIAVGRSFRLHRPRGPICGEGYCFQCEVDTPAGRILACRTPPGARAERVDAGTSSCCAGCRRRLD